MDKNKDKKELKRMKKQKVNKKKNTNEPRVLEFNLSKSILVLLLIGMIIGVITTARIITMNEGKQNNALATEDGKNSERVNWVTSSDGIEVPVPKGYVASQIPGETSVSGGFVIYEDTAEGINWDTILETSSASTLSLDETTTKNETENKNETITNTEATNKDEETNNNEITNKNEVTSNNETTNKNEVINNDEETNKNEITNDTEKETNPESPKETEEKKEEIENKVTNSETEFTTEATTEKKEEVNVEETTKTENTEEIEKNLNKEEITKNEEETNKVETENKQEKNNIENVKSEGMENKETLTNAKIEKATSEEKAVSTETNATNIEEIVEAEEQAETTGIEAMAEDTSVNTNIFNLQKSTNQYVWIPVNDITRIYGVDSNGKLWGKLYDVSSPERSKSNWEYATEANKIINIGSKTGNREPDVTHYNTNYDIDSKLQEYLYGETQYELLSKELERHFYETIESIKKYGGFYIGRYETGELSGKAVIRKMNTDISNQEWYTMYKKCKTLKGKNRNVITSMIWGSLWDETLQWLIDSEAKTSDGTTTLVHALVGSDSRTWGNYANVELNYISAEDGTEKTKADGEKIKIPAGSSEKTKINNIYDLAGNVWDRTLEANSTSGRAGRGGFYNGDGTIVPAGNRSGYGNLNNAYEGYGCRAALYVK